MRITVAIFCAALLLAGQVSWLGASDTALDRETLRSVKTLYVLVSLPGNSGLDGSQIQRDVSQRLRAGGVSLTDVKVSTIALPCLLVSVNLLKRQDGSLVYEVSVSLNQEVTVKSTNASYMAATWSVSTLAVAKGSGMARYVEADIRGLAVKFVNAYESANRH